jgi:hypothetical protein
MTGCLPEVCHAPSGIILTTVDEARAPSPCEGGTGSAELFGNGADPGPTGKAR